MLVNREISNIYENVTAAGSNLTKDQFDILIDGLIAAPKPRQANAALSLFFQNLSAVPDEIKDSLSNYLFKLWDIKDSKLDIKDTSNRLNRLRVYLANHGLSGLVIPRSDEHLGEYVPACSQRLKWLTGFTGSAGVAIVLEKSAALFVDGRYTIQAANEVPDSLFEKINVSTESYTNWLKRNIDTGKVFGYDPKLHSIKEFKKLSEICANKGVVLKPLDNNPIDELWDNQPPPPLSAVTIHELKYAGEPVEKKVLRVGNIIKKSGANAAILSAPDSIAWLLNIRGNDIPNCPLSLCFAIIFFDGSIKLFIDIKKLTHQSLKHLKRYTSIHDLNSLESSIHLLGQNGNLLLVDENTTPQWFASIFEKSGGKLVYGLDPCCIPKSLKNPIELSGARAAHLRDGAALTRFLAWLELNNENLDIDELLAAEKLAEFRSEGNLYQGPSFDTISSAGSNAAIIHYQANKNNNYPLQKDNIYLVDSGGQYLDGTTDVTRTVAIGKPSEEMRDRFTRVLKGHIALATARFPVGTRGSQLDILARQYLWSIGLDYNHGTGHGVGSYLNVHEGPQRIAKSGGEFPLEQGMILSNEPGYYQEDDFGIRIENLVAVIKCPKSINTPNEMLAFETLTLAPIDKYLIDKDELNIYEIAWLDAYHARVKDELGRVLEKDKFTLDWLIKATEPIKFI